MYLALTAVALCVLVVAWTKHKRSSAQQEMERHSITPEALHSLLDAKSDVLLLDVRQPLDLLASYEIIPGAKRIPPKEILANPTLISPDKESIVYCTCPSDKTSREILHRALALNLLRVKFLKGGLEAWKAKGFPVEPYNEVFHLDTAT
jgi:rhodanese-related sulfurtransferase